MDLTALSARELSARLQRRELSSRELMTAILDRIDAVNPAINAIVALRDRDALLAEADAADAAPRNGWLHGIPIAIKNLVDTAGIPTSYGSPLYAKHVPAEDALLVTRIKAAGAIVIGKTNTPEFGLGSHSFNPVHGVTRNPYDTARSAGGSSGGAAAALAGRLIPVADGSDTMGSLRNPAAFCNVYGFRPSWGLCPADPGSDVFLNQITTDGPMARDPLDLAALLETLAGPDPRVPLGRPSQPFAPVAAAGTGRPLRIGWLGDWGGAYPLEDGIAETCEAALGQLEALGHRVDVLPPPFPADDIWQSWLTLRWLANAGGYEADYDDPARRAHLKPSLLWEIERGRALTAPAILRASALRLAWFRRAAELFAVYDVLALPAAQVWPFPAEWQWPERIGARQMDTYHRWMEVVVPVSLIGLPALAAPAGFGPQGLPAGLQLFGPPGADARLLALGHDYHQATDWPGRRPPPL